MLTKQPAAAQTAVTAVSPSTTFLGQPKDTIDTFRLTTVFASCSPCTTAAAVWAWAGSLSCLDRPRSRDPLRTLGSCSATCPVRFMLYHSGANEKTTTRDTRGSRRFEGVAGRRPYVAESVSLSLFSQLPALTASYNACWWLILHTGVDAGCPGTRICVLLSSTVRNDHMRAALQQLTVMTPAQCALLRPHVGAYHSRYFAPTP